MVGFDKVKMPGGPTVLYVRLDITLYKIFKWQPGGVMLLKFISDYTIKTQGVSNFFQTSLLHSNYAAATEQILSKLG